MGMSDSMLQAARVTVATLAAPGAGGKTPDLVLFALDAGKGTLDPAYDVTTLPLKHWALAWWEGWVSPVDLSRAAKYAAAALRPAATSVWSRVTGPVAALLASIWRIGWDMVEPHILLTDVGRVLDLRLDPPAVVQAEAKVAVRRWQLARVLKLNPLWTPTPAGGTCPDPLYRPPIPECFRPPPIVALQPLTARLPEFVVGITKPLVKLLAGTGRPKAPGWDCKFRPYLLSTLVGGQWAQVGVVTVLGPDTEKTCRLCREEDGTLEHRHRCRATLPDGGWPGPDPEVQHLMDGLDQARGLALRTRGFLAIHLPIRPPCPDGWMDWVMPLPDEDLHDATWFIDGSAVDGPSKPTIRFGFGIAVVGHDGRLLAYAWGAPPDWVTDVPGTEGWAMYMVAKINPALPRLTTDCLGLVTALARGPDDAARADRPLARLWRLIFGHTAAVVPGFAAADRVVWMPAHCTRDAARFAVQSNGEKVSLLDWRANNLVDHLARAAASRNRAPAGDRRCLELATRAGGHCAARVGATSWAANHSPHTTTRADGSTVTLLCRDSEPPPAAKVGHPTGTGSRRRRPASAPPEPTAAAHCGGKGGIPAASESAAACRTTKAELALLADARWHRTWLTDMHAKRLLPLAGPSATQRMDAMRERVRARSLASSSSAPPR